MLLAMIVWYCIPVVVLVASLFVASRSPKRTILYLSALLVFFVAVMVVAGVAVPDDLGVWIFFVFPAALVTWIRLIVALVLYFSPGADDVPRSAA